MKDRESVFTICEYDVFTARQSPDVKSLKTLPTTHPTVAFFANPLFDKQVVGIISRCLGEGLKECAPMT
jgi:hypothetical protein